MTPREPDAVGDDQPGGSRRQRFTRAISDFALKPSVAMENATGNDQPAQEGPTTVAELEAAIKRADDKERLIGLLAAPVAAAIVFLVMSTLVHNDPSPLLGNGLPNPRHVNPNIYTELGLVTLALALIMLAGAWFRKRLVIGIASALYGLSFFNLHYWGFGVPYIMIGSWYLVRAYRLSAEAQGGQAGGRTVLGPGRSPDAAQQALHAAQRAARPGTQVQAGQGNRSRLNRPRGPGRRRAPGRCPGDCPGSDRSASVPATDRPAGPRPRPPHTPVSRRSRSVHTLVTRK